MTGRRTISTLLLLAGVTIALVTACRKGESAPSAPTPLTLKVPAGFPAPNDIFRDNPLTKEGVELGRRLFYDGRLAKDGLVSCGSCHQPFAAFSTFDHDFSHGIDNQFTTRNAPGLFNLAWHRELHWDGGINHLEVQPLAPITASNEMGEELSNILKKLNADAKYREMFRAAFGQPEATSQRMLKALSQFMGLIVSADSKYDRVRAGKENFTQAEAAGYEVFKIKCTNCHQEPLFTDLSYRNTGMPIDPLYKDPGRMHITRLASDSLKFKVPSLRNVALTKPYGHDGRFYSLSAVIDHYRSGPKAGPTVDPALRAGLSISNNEKADLLQFLSTLTDTTFTKDPRFTEPL
jgi:cytochrome c peroxidase